MEVSKDHRAAEKVQPSIIGGMKTAGRFAVLGLALTLGGHDTKQPHAASAPADTVQRDCDGCDDPSTLAPGTPLVGRTLRIRRDDVRDVIVRIIRRDGALELHVDGKAYGLQDTMNVSVGRAIGTVEMGDGEVSVHAPEYGVAIVTRAEIERVLYRLADAESSVVTADVSTRFSPKPGTALGAAVAMKRMWNGWTEGEPESYDVSFVRRDPEPVTLAMTAGNR